MSHNDVTVEVLNEHEAEEMLDQIARQKMGISISEFRRRAAAGHYRDIDLDSVPGLVDVAILAGLDH